MTTNLLLCCDSYKAGHARLYPPGMTSMYSYLESRGGRYPATVFFGLQYYLARYLVGQAISPYEITEAERFWPEHFGRDDYFDGDAWRRLWQAHGGRLPIRIKAVKEGTLVPTHNVLMTVENTDPEFPWLVGWLETLLMKLWFPITVATQSYYLREGVRMRFEESGSPAAALDFAVHDFGYRGVSSEESAAIGGAAHLLSFNGTDTVAGIRLLQRHYGAGMAGFSVPATEHSVICAFGPDGEEDAYAHLLRQFPTGTIACVSDTYDIFNAVELLWGGSLHEQVLAREGGALVVRPDSGDPTRTVLRVLDILGECYGGRIRQNEAGFKVLPPQVRVIQGDGMDHESIPRLYDALLDEGWAAENLAVGSGGGLLQKVDRDTCRFAIKASEVVVDGEARPISKSPITDMGKRSKAGRLKLVPTTDGESYFTVSSALGSMFPVWEDSLETVFENGEIVRRQTLDGIRALVRG